MALPVQKQAQYWGIAAAVFILVLWAVGNVLTPFILAGAIAYLLDPIADWLEKRGLSRGLAVAIISLVLTLVVTLLVLLVVPVFVRQVQDLVVVLGTLPERAPDLSSRFTAWVSANSGLEVDQQALRDGLAQAGRFIEERSGQLASGILNSAASLLGVVVFFVLVPVTTVYLLVDWDRMVGAIDRLLPRDHAPKIRQIFADIDRTLASFIRGQGTVCLILGTYYSVALALVGLNFGVAIGAVAGLITFIPYVGAFFGGGLALGVALFQFWGEWWMIAVVAVIFFSGQTIEGNFLTPLLVGSSVGLHPVWLLIALSVFGALFGFTGLLVAVPVAAVIGVLVRFAAETYTSSPLYLGVSNRLDKTASGSDDDAA